MVVKGLDVMGLVPLRWFLTILITPRVAKYIQRPVHAMFDKGRAAFRSLREGMKRK